MKVAAIIAEYNPFHLGHKYQLEQVRKITDADVVVVLMSGNIVQRGEFALLDKWTRSELALSYGADLVLELPLLASLQSADYFAYWSVKVLESLKIDSLVYGTETATTQQINSYVEWLSINQHAIDDSIKKFLSQGYSYAASYEMAMDEFYSPQEESNSFNVFKPNHMLGIRYTKALKEFDSTMETYALPRITEDEVGQTILSGSKIREAYFNNSITANALPMLTYQALQSGTTTQNTDYYALLKYQVESQGAERLRQYFNIDNGIEKHIHQQMNLSDDYDSLIKNLTSKRWTKATIQRKLMTILLNITKEEWIDSLTLNQERLTIRILGYNEVGKQFIKAHRTNDKVNLFSNLTQDFAKSYLLNLRADRIYSLNPNKKITEQNVGRYPKYFK